MKYQTPEVTALTSAVNAIKGTKNQPVQFDGLSYSEDVVGAHEDWE